MKGKDFIILAAPPWELEIGSNIRNMALEISKDNRVIYVNPPIDRNTLWRERNNKSLQQKRKESKVGNASITQINENLWLFHPKRIAESINWIPFYSIFEWFNEINVKRLAEDIKEVTCEMGFGNFIIINDSLMFKGFGIEKYLSPNLYLYYTRDNLITQPYFKKHGVNIEPKIMTSVDGVIANSIYLKDYGARYNQNSYYVGQGYENQNFDFNKQHNKPKELQQITTPIIGYIGALTSLRLDVDLMIYIAKNLKDHAMVLVGTEDDVFKNSELHNLDNVYFLGLKRMHELAGFLSYFDVCINPQLINDLTVGNYPIKIDEYLAMGRPVVVTDTPTMDSFIPFVYTANTPHDYCNKIEKALNENSADLEKQRVDFSSKHTWENCIIRIYEILNNLANESK